jgi:hypothetical protein
LNDFAVHDFALLSDTLGPSGREWQNHHRQNRGETILQNGSIPLRRLGPS